MRVGDMLIEQRVHRTRWRTTAILLSELTEWSARGTASNVGRLTGFEEIRGSFGYLPLE